ncbi:MAG: ribosome assembly cofactor RimP [Porphyromonadaceae bacterium CG2_30_38_12]|nr:MAG: ribosome assembly cofactor RimP [Porphyromonadaceae bacterium CG2_30_38_12]
MISKDAVSQLVTAYIAESSYFLVDVNVSPDNRISVEIDSFHGVALDYCIALSKEIEAKFDREVEDYELEVSSAGLTEPFKIITQYEKNKGKEVEVLTKTGQKLIGTLTRVTATEFSIRVAMKEQQEGSKRKTLVDKEITFNYNDIKYTKYIIRFK